MTNAPGVGRGRSDSDREFRIQSTRLQAGIRLSAVSNTSLDGAKCCPKVTRFARNAVSVSFWHPGSSSVRQYPGPLNLMGRRTRGGKRHIAYRAGLRTGDSPSTWVVWNCRLRTWDPRLDRFCFESITLTDALRCERRRPRRDFEFLAGPLGERLSLSPHSLWRLRGHSLEV